MALSAIQHASHATPSPSCQYFASILPGKSAIRLHAAHALDRYTDIAIRISAKDITNVHWSPDSDQVVVLSAKLIEVISLADSDHRIRLDNGSGGFGRFAVAEFVGNQLLLVVWEFGRAKIWDLGSGRSGDLGEVKGPCDGTRWGLRPGRQSTLALLSRDAAEDVLNLHLPATQRLMGAVRLPTTDAQSIEWSPDGKWIGVLDVGTASQGVHFLTPDGHLYRSYPAVRDAETLGLGVKSMVWAASGQLVALTRYDGRIVLLNTRTFAPKAVIEHTTTIDQRASIAVEQQQAMIWEEAVSSSGERTYSAITQPFSPPLTQTKPTTDPADLGVAEAHFSCDASWLATRDERMLNTVWIWNMATLSSHTVLVQHSNVRKVHWHPTRADDLMLDCGEGVAYFFSASNSSPPEPIFAFQNAAISWLNTAESAAPVVLATTKSSFRFLFPDGQPEEPPPEKVEESFTEGASEDSLLDLLSGRKPLAAKTEPSYTERVDLEVETEEDTSSVKLDDTFRQMHGRRAIETEAERDPFDDSDIF